MKIQVVSFRRRLLYLSAVAGALMFEPAVLFAQDNKGRQLLQNMNQALVGILDTLATLVRTVMGLGAIVTLIVVIFKLYKGEREAAEKLAWWVAALTLGFVMLTVVVNLVKTS